MFDPHTYMIRIFKAHGDHASTVLWLETLSAIMVDKFRIVKVLSPQKLDELLRQFKCPAAVKETVHSMVRNNDLKLLPRVAKSYRRELANQGLLVVDLTTQSDNEQYDTRAFGSKAIIIRHTDPNLLAGARVVLPDRSYEYSARSMLAHVQSTLKTK